MAESSTELIPPLIDAKEAVDSTAPVEEESLPINVLGLVSICVFYLIVLAIGVWAGWSQKKKTKSSR
jgi:hypothetical protein